MIGYRSIQDTREQGLRVAANNEGQRTQNNKGTADSAHVFFFLAGLLDAAAAVVLAGVDEREVLSSAFNSSRPRFYGEVE